MTITVSHTISMGHRLPSYDGICNSPHGHNVKVEAEVASKNGGFLDFKAVAKDLKSILEPMDHAMVLWQGDDLLRVLAEMNFRTYRMELEPTTENIAKLIFYHLTRMGFYDYLVYSVTVHETDKYSAKATA